MMKTIFKYGLICGFLLLVIEYLPFIPFLNYYFDSSIQSPLKFVGIGGTMLFAINYYLKEHNRNKNYNYAIGFVLCLGLGVVGVFICTCGIILLVRLDQDLYLNLSQLFARVVLYLPLIIILSLIIPATFRNKKRNEIVSDRDDILDSNL